MSLPQEAPPDHMSMPKRLPLLVMPDNRDETTTKDAKLVNGISERNLLTGEYNIEKRPGYSAPVYTLTDAGANSGDGRGIYMWNVIGATTSVIHPAPSHKPVTITTPVLDLVLIAASGNTLFYAKLVSGSPVMAPFATSILDGGKFRFTPLPLIHAGVADDPGLLAQSGTQVKVCKFDTGTRVVTSYTDLSSNPDFPTGIVQGTVYLDGYTFVMDTAGKIYNSALNDTTDKWCFHHRPDVSRWRSIPWSPTQLHSRY